MSGFSGGGKYPSGQDSSSNNSSYDKDKDAVNPLYLATSKSENSTLNRHTRSAKDTTRFPQTHETSPSSQCNRISPNPFAGTGTVASPGSSQTLDRKRHVIDNKQPDSSTWDRIASGVAMVGLNSPQTSSNTNQSVSSGSGLIYARNEEIEAAVIGSTSASKAPPPTMQARTLQLSSAASNDQTRELRHIPAVNCPEKIILCLDVSKEMESLSFRTRSGDRIAFNALVKKALGIFFQTKHIMSGRHEFALMFLTGTSLWMCDFTADPSKLLTIIDDMDESTALEEACDLSSILDAVEKKTEFSFLSSSSDTDVPPYIVRVILIYGRSQCVPQLSLKKHHMLLQQADYFFVDVLYVHDPPSSENECEKIFEVLCDLDVRGTSYILEVSTNPAILYNCMAQLLAHPLQRPLQQNVNYCLNEPVQ